MVSRRLTRGARLGSVSGYLYRHGGTAARGAKPACQGRISSNDTLSDARRTPILTQQDMSSRGTAPTTASGQESHLP